MDTATLVGRKANLAAEFRGFTPDIEWTVKNATSVGGKVILAVNNGTKGLAAPIDMFVLQEAEPVAPASKPRATRFKLDGAEKDSPLYEVFQRCAPDDELSKELYTLYQAEYSEFDTDFLGTLAGQVNATLDAKWNKEQVGEMLQLLNSSYDEQAQAAEPLPFMEVVEAPAIQPAPVVEELVPEPEEVEPDPEPAPMPALRVVPEPVVSAVLDNFPPVEAAPMPKRRGRPPGSRNKPSLDKALNILREDSEGVLARRPINETKQMADKVMRSNTPPELVALALKLAAVITETAAAAGDEFPSVLEHAFGIVENLF